LSIYKWESIINFIESRTISVWATTNGKILKKINLYNIREAPTSKEKLGLLDLY